MVGLCVQGVTCGIPRRDQLSEMFLRDSQVDPGVSLVAVQFEHFLECFNGSFVLLQVLVAEPQVVPDHGTFRNFTG